MSKNLWKLINERKAVKRRMMEPSHRGLKRNSEKSIDPKIERLRKA